MSNYRSVSISVFGAVIEFRHFANNTIQIMGAWVECWRSFLHETGISANDEEEVSEWALDCAEVIRAIEAEINA